MTYALALEDRAPVELLPGNDVTFSLDVEVPAGDEIVIETQQFTASYETMTRWTDAERAQRSIYPIVDDPIPDGKIATGSSLEKVGQVVQRHWTLTDAPPYVPPVPQSISDRQFFQQLAVDNIISEQEALDSNAAIIPPALLQIIETLPAGQQFDAKMKVSGATVFNRDDPLTIGIGQAYGMSAGDIDQFFTEAAAL